MFLYLILSVHFHFRKIVDLSVRKWDPFFSLCSEISIITSKVTLTNHSLRCIIYTLKIKFIRSKFVLTIKLSPSNFKFLMTSSSVVCRHTPVVVPARSHTSTRDINGMFGHSCFFIDIGKPNKFDSR